MIMLQQKWLKNKLADMSMNMEERLENILKTKKPKKKTGRYPQN